MSDLQHLLSEVTDTGTAELVGTITYSLGVLGIGDWVINQGMVVDTLTVYGGSGWYIDIEDDYIGAGRDDLMRGLVFARDDSGAAAAVSWVATWLSRRALNATSS